MPAAWGDRPDRLAEAVGCVVDLPSVDDREAVAARMDRVEQTGLPRLHEIADTSWELGLGKEGGQHRQQARRGPDCREEALAVVGSIVGGRPLNASPGRSGVAARQSNPDTWFAACINEEAGGGRDRRR
jgi:hypothetical protein